MLRLLLLFVVKDDLRVEYYLFLSREDTCEHLQGVVTGCQLESPNVLLLSTKDDFVIKFVAGLSTF